MKINSFLQLAETVAVLIFHLFKATFLAKVALAVSGGLRGKSPTQRTN